MELEINEPFLKHYNEYKPKEEAAKTKKKLKKEIKEIQAESDDDSSACSDSENAPQNINKFLEQCDNLLRDIDSKSTTELLSSQPSFTGIFVDKTIKETEKPIYPKDLNMKILIENGGLENEDAMRDIERYSLMESEEMFKLLPKSIDLGDINNIDTDDEELLKPSKKPTIIDYSKIVELDNEESNRDESDHDSDDEIDERKSMENKPFGKFEINRDRKLVTVKVSKTLTRSEKRQIRKEKKEKELKEKMKKLQEIQHASLLEKLEKIKKTLPKKIANQLSIDDLDEDFNIEEFSQRMSSIFEKEDGNLPIDEEKPVFSDESDIDFNDICEVNEEKMEMEEEEENQIEDVKKVSKKKKKTILSKKNPSYFTNVSVEENDSSKKRKKFDFLGEDLIRGANENDDILCKFKFRKVEKQDYGLGVEEIILADNKELNQWASLKKIVRLRTPIQEEKDRIKYSSEDILKKKRVILASLYKEESEEDQSEKEASSLSKSAKKHLKKALKKKKQKELTEPEPTISSGQDSKTVSTEIKKEEKKVSKKRKIVDNSENQLIENPITENVNPEPKKKKSKKSKQIDNENQSIENPITENVNPEPKKKKSKQSQPIDNENQKIDEGKIQKNKKPKKKKVNANSVPILNANRLESMGINAGYYKHKLCKKDA